MGLSYAEKEGCRQILYKLDITDLLSLYQTVVKTKPSVHNKAELIERIIEKSNTAAELLNRRKVYKDIILQYLNNKHISMLAKSTKYDAMEKAQEHWQHQANIQPCLMRFVEGSTSLEATFGVQKYELRDEQKDHYVQQEETKAASKAELRSVKQIKDGTKDHYAERVETEAATKAGLGSVKKTKDGEIDRHIQRTEIKTVNKEAPGSVKETEQSATTTTQTCKEYDTEFKSADFHYTKEASQNCLPSSHCEVLPYIKHLIKLMSDQQKKQDQQYHIVQQLLDMQKENSEQLKDLKEAQQIDQHEVLLLQLKENKNHQLFLTDLLQEIKNLIQQQNSLIFLQLQQQQQDFQAKLMKDLAKNTEEQVNVLLQAFYKCKPHQTSYNEQSLREEVLNRDKQGRELLQCEPVGQAFCNQFYPLWNSQNPSYGQTENITWGPHLFCENATAEMIHYDNEQQVSQHHDGVECVSDSLLNLTKQERLEFRPSIDTERFKCVNSKHGLVVVAVTGTIFRDKRFIGVFEQTFGLNKCPEMNNLKIKFINLKIKYFNHIHDSVTVPILTYTTEQLENI